MVYKAIVNHIKLIMDKAVSPTQASFVPRRQISNNVVNFQEMLQTMRKNNVARYITLKIDLKWPMIIFVSHLSMKLLTSN